MAWIDLLQSLGFFTVAVAALTWLLKKLMTQILSRDLEKFRSSLQLETIQHQVRFSRIHEKQAEVIEKYYQHIQIAYHSIKQFRNSKEKQISEDDRKALDRAFTQIFQAGVFHLQNDLYFTDKTSALIQEFQLDVFHYAGFSQGIISFIDSEKFIAAPENRKHMIEDAIKGGLQNVEDKMDPLLNAIRADFQILLGVNKRI